MGGFEANERQNRGGNNGGDAEDRWNEIRENSKGPESDAATFTGARARAKGDIRER